MRRRTGLLIAAALLLTGCASSPDTLEGTVWKITELTAPDGTQYDEAAYDTIIGATYYRFGTDGQMAARWETRQRIRRLTAIPMKRGTEHFLRPDVLQRQREGERDPSYSGRAGEARLQPAGQAEVN